MESVSLSQVTHSQNCDLNKNIKVFFYYFYFTFSLTVTFYKKRKKYIFIGVGNFEFGAVCAGFSLYSVISNFGY